LCESFVKARSWFKRVVATSQTGQNTLKYNGHGLCKPSVPATILEIGQARDRFLVEVFSCLWGGAIGCMKCNELAKPVVLRTTLRCTRNQGV
jgi:hypothetical protein